VELRRLAAGARTKDDSRTRRMAELEQAIAAQGRRCTELRSRHEQAAESAVGPEEVRAVLQSFDPVWKVLTGEERSRIVRAITQQVVYDGRTGEVRLTLEDSVLELLQRRGESGG